MCPARTGIMVHAVLRSLREQAVCIARVFGCAAWLVLRWHGAAPAGSALKAEMLLCCAVLKGIGLTPLCAEYPTNPMRETLCAEGREGWSITLPARPLSLKLLQGGVGSR